MDPNVLLKEIEGEFHKMSKEDKDNVWDEKCTDLHSWLSSGGFAPDRTLAPIGWTSYQFWHFEVYGLWPE